MEIQIIQAKKCTTNYSTCFECSKDINECTDDLSKACINDLPEKYYPTTYIITD